MDCIELSRIRGIDPEIDSILLLTFQCLFFILFTRILLQINVCWQPKGKGHLKQFAYSSLVSVLFSLIVWLGVSPVIRSTNQNIREKYERNEPKENHRFHGKKLFYLFHEPEEAWYNNLFTLFVGIYTFSRIYILAARKEEVERNYEKLKNESLQSQIDALYNQINPHFLYNSLSVINWMAIRSNQREISKVTLSLSMFYRTALSKGQDMVTVDNCIQNIKAYLDIQLVMHDNDFQVIWVIDPEVKGDIVPKLLIQPVVENALEHGLDMKEEGEKILKLIFVQDGTDVLLAVEDNGPGMEQKEADKLVTYQASGYGLKNVNDRIKLLYGDSYEIRVLSKVGEGTRVEMRIPRKLAGEEVTDSRTVFRKEIPAKC